MIIQQSKGILKNALRCARRIRKKTALWRVRIQQSHILNHSANDLARRYGLVVFRFAFARF